MRGKNLKNIDFDNNIAKEDLRDIRQMAKNYYSDYIKGTSVFRDDVGNIAFGNAGIDELTSRGLQNIKTLPDLKSQIKKGELKSGKFDYPRKDISKFDIIENNLANKRYEYQIADDIATGKKFYFAKDISNKKNLSATDRKQYPGSKTDSFNIISNSIPKLKSTAEWLEEWRRQRGHK